MRYLDVNHVSDIFVVWFCTKEVAVAWSFSFADISFLEYSSPEDLQAILAGIDIKNGFSAEGHFTTITAEPPSTYNSRRLFNTPTQ